MAAARPLPPLFWVFWWGSIVNRLGTLVVPYLTFPRRYQGAWNMTHGVASCLGPLLGTWLLSDVGAGPLWLGCAVLGLVAALGYLGLAPALRRCLADRASES